MAATSRLPRSNWFVWLFGAFCLLAVFAAYLSFDIWAAISLRPGAVVLACVMCLPGCLLLGYQRTRGARLLLLAIVIAIVVLVPFVSWDTRKPFLRALHSVEVGMTAEEVDRVMAPYIRRPSAPGSVNEDGLVGYGHTTAGWGDSDAGLVYFAGGRVVRTVFFPD